MSVTCMAEVWKLDLPRDEKIVLLALADHADDFGGNIKPSIARVAMKCGYSRRSIDRKLAALKTRGILVEVERPDGYPVEYLMQTEGYAKLALPKRVRYAKGDVGDTTPVAQGGTPTVAHEPSVEPSIETNSDLFCDSETVEKFVEEVGRFCSRTGASRWPLSSQTLREWCRELTADVRYASVDLSFQTKLAGEHWEPIINGNGNKRPKTFHPPARLRTWFGNSVRFAQENSKGQQVEENDLEPWKKAIRTARDEE